MNPGNVTKAFTWVLLLFVCFLVVVFLILALSLSYPFLNYDTTLPMHIPRGSYVYLSLV